MNSSTTETYPKLRPLDIQRHIHQGQPYILLRDPMQLSEKTLFIPQAMAAVLAFCDGASDAMTMADAFTQHYGIPIQPDTVCGLLAALDDALLLDNDRSGQALSRLLDEYRHAPFRRPMLAGRGYPAEPAALHNLLQNYLESIDEAPKPLAMWPARVGLLSPHIDYIRGGEIYAKVWKHASEAVKAAELIVLFGTDHYGDDPWTLTRQHYATPYGLLPTDQGIVDELAAIIGEEAAFAGELRHRDEHALELVAIWLHHIRGGQPCVVVPILTGTLQSRSTDDASLGNDAVRRRVLAKLNELCHDRRVLVVASGDLAHVGPQFGGAPLDADSRLRLREADDELIGYMQAGDSKGFYASIRRVDNVNNVCGVSPIYHTICLLGMDNGTGIRGETVGYAACPADEQNTSTVTVCGIVFG